MEPVIIVRDLDLVKKITVKDFEYFHDHRAFIDKEVEPMAARNLFLLKGKKIVSEIWYTYSQNVFNRYKKYLNIQEKTTVFKTVF